MPLRDDGDGSLADDDAMSTFDYTWRAKSRSRQERLAEVLEHAIDNGTERPGDREMLGELVRLLLSRKRATTAERERLRAKWGRYA